MDKVVMTSEQQLAFDGFIDVMVQIYKMTADTDESSGKCKKVMLNPMDRQKD